MKRSLDATSPLPGSRPPVGSESSGGAHPGHRTAPGLAGARCLKCLSGLHCSTLPAPDTRPNGGGNARPGPGCVSVAVGAMSADRDEVSSPFRRCVSRLPDRDVKRLRTIAAVPAGRTPPDLGRERRVEVARDQDGIVLVPAMGGRADVLEVGVGLRPAVHAEVAEGAAVAQPPRELQIVVPECG
eukprot:12624082-Heterocapsa_arctica.AAC.1